MKSVLRRNMLSVRAVRKRRITVCEGRRWARKRYRIRARRKDQNEDPSGRHHIRYEGEEFQ